MASGAGTATTLVLRATACGVRFGPLPTKPDGDMDLPGLLRQADSVSPGCEPIRIRKPGRWIR